MLSRCRNPREVSFENYGGRGITVCERWLDFAAFFADMGPRPDGTTLDRKDNNGNYEPGNCRWATRRDQSRNTSVNRMIELDGVALCLTDWVARSGMPRSTLRSRLRKGWDIRRAITEPIMACQQRGKK